MKNLNEIKKILDIDNTDIAEIFLFKSAGAYANSTAKNRFDNGIKELYKIFKMEELIKLKNAKNTKGLLKYVDYSLELESLVNNLNLTTENNKYANAYINKDSKFKYESEGVQGKKEGVRVINYNEVSRKNDFRIYRK